MYRWWDVDVVKVRWRLLACERERDLFLSRAGFAACETARV